MNIKVDELVRLQSRKDRIRNLCILAHVDHGKTSLSDNLIGSNGLIHSKLVGELRYLDFKEEEQKRGITMKSSSISLLYCPSLLTGQEGLKGLDAETRFKHGYLVNLIDSPGHVDFCSEVSTAVRLSDGCVVVVDAVEGVCIQTHAVMRQAFEERVTPCLMLNKVDRLILELRLTPLEVYQRLMSTVTHANMVMSAMQSEKHLREADAVLAASAITTSGVEDVECSSEEDVFQPSKGNVVFGSAVDGWGFRVDQMAAMWAEKVGAKAGALSRAMWGDWGLLAKEKRIVRANRNKLKPLFVQLALEPIWKAYSVCAGEPVMDVLLPIVRSRRLSGVTDKMLQQPDPRQALKAVLRAWLPVSDAVLGCAVTHLPSPEGAAPDRMPRLLSSPPDLACLPAAASKQLAAVERAVTCCDSRPGAPVVVYVSKMVAVPSGMIPRLPGESRPTARDTFLGFARVLSGVLHIGQRVHVILPPYSPAQPQKLRQTAVASALYLMMGQSLEKVKQVPAGNLVAIAGLETVILKSATLSSTPACIPLAPMNFQAAPIVRVAVEPKRPSDLAALMQGLALLNRADPLVEVSYGESGEVVVGAAGEVHLETCMKDLEERFAGVPIQVSPPLVAFRESVFCAAEAQEGASTPPPVVVEASVASGVVAIRVRAFPLPADVATAIEAASNDLRAVLADRGNSTLVPADRGTVLADRGDDGAGLPAGHGCSGGPSGVERSAAVGCAVRRRSLDGHGGVGGAGELESLVQQLQAAAEEDKTLQSLLQRLWLLGPAGVGPCALVVRDRTQPSLFSVPAAGVVTLARGQTSRSHDYLQMLKARTEGDNKNGAGGVNANDQALVMEGGTEPLHLGAPMVSLRLGLCSTSSSSAITQNTPTTNLTHPVSNGRQSTDHPRHHMNNAHKPDTNKQCSSTDPDRGSTAMASGKATADLGSTTPGLSSTMPELGSTARDLGSTTTDTAAAAAAATGAPQQQERAQDQVEGSMHRHHDVHEVLSTRSQSGGSVRHEGSIGGDSRASNSDQAQALVAPVEAGVVAGFQLATSSGPMCDENMWGVAFEMEVELRRAGPRGDYDPQEEVYGPLSAQVMTSACAAFRRAMLEAGPRLVEAMSMCQVVAEPEALSGVYAVLGRRRGRIVREDMNEGSGQFVVGCYLPMAASFGLADDLRHRCSGAATASLMLSHWERLQVDPFFVPTTEEEREEFGEDAVNMANVARTLVDSVRRRKGLPVADKVVEKATKQRTVKRNV